MYPARTTSKTCLFVAETNRERSIVASLEELNGTDGLFVFDDEGLLSLSLVLIDPGASFVIYYAYVLWT